MPNKINIVKINIIILLILLAFGGALFLRHVNKYGFKIQSSDEINTDPKYVRIYYDFATASSMYELYDYLLQDPNSTVFLRWDRTPNLKEKLKSRKNTYILQHVKNIDHTNFDPTPVLEYYKKHPDTQFIIHSTHNWIVNLLPIIRNLPKKAIKEVHIYEDGAYMSSFVNPDGDLWNGIDLYKLYHEVFDAPLIFHMEDAKYLNSFRCLFDKRCVGLKTLHKNDTLAESSIKYLKEKLNENQEVKDEYFRIFDFDYKMYEKLMTHPFGIYTFAIWYHPVAAKQELKFMHELLYGNLNYLVKDKNVKWFYKEHPYNHQKHMYSETLSKTNPELIRIDNAMPIELFLISGIIPDYVAGYSSSTYLSYPKKSICAYIKRPDDIYMEIIKRDHRIRPGRVFDITDTDDSFKSRFNRLKSRILVFFQ